MHSYLLIKHATQYSHVTLITITRDTECDRYFG